MAALSDLRGRHSGADIYVVGSGPTLDFYDPEFFRDRVTIAINWVAHRRPIPATYTLTKYHDIAGFMAHTYPDMTVVVSRHMYGNPHMPATESGASSNLVVFDSKPGQVPGTGFRVGADWPDDPDQLVNSHSSITSGMHLAAYMGAGTIFMVGHDAGLLDGRMHFDGYRTTPDPNTTPEWLVGFDRHSREVKTELERRYGCRVYGLLPFINARMEGHTYP